MRLERKDYEMLGWAMMADLGPAVAIMALLDSVDECYAALLAGRAAGRAGALVGENPASCDACRRAWTKGWTQGNLALQAGPVVRVVLS